VILRRCARPRAGNPELPRGISISRSCTARRSDNRARARARPAKFRRACKLRTYPRRAIRAFSCGVISTTARVVSLYLFPPRFYSLLSSSLSLPLSLSLSPLFRFSGGRMDTHASVWPDIKNQDAFVGTISVDGHNTIARAKKERERERESRFSPLRPVRSS